MNKLSHLCKKIEVVSEGLQDINKHFDSIELDVFREHCNSNIFIELAKCKMSIKISLVDMWYLLDQLELNKFSHISYKLEVVSDGLLDIDNHIYFIYIDVLMGRNDFNLDDIKLVVECVKSMKLPLEEMRVLLGQL